MNLIRKLKLRITQSFKTTTLNGRVESCVIKPFLPSPTCQDCGKKCNRFEWVDTGCNQKELWCYCKICDIETFHTTPSKDL